MRPPVEALRGAAVPLLVAAAVLTFACSRRERPAPPPAVVEDAGPASDGAPEAAPPRDAEARDAGEAADAEPSPLDRVRVAAPAMLEEGTAERWGRQARLGPEDLTCDYATLGEHGLEVFSVLDADGYEGHYKCNLFAFELIYRAGLLVPVISRVRGWTFPGPLCVSRMIEGERVDGDWARGVDERPAAELAALPAAGRVLLVSGSGTRGRTGHVGVVEQVHRIERDRAGRITTLDYTGWEANADRARHRRRTWESWRFGRIQLIELRMPEPAARQVVAVGPPPDEPSLADRERLSAAAVAAAADNPRTGDMGAWPGGARIPEHGPPRLPVVHQILGSDSVFGAVLDVDRVVTDEGEAAADAVSKTRVTPGAAIDVSRVLDRSDDSR